MADTCQGVGYSVFPPRKPRASRSECFLCRRPICRLAANRHVCLGAVAGQEDDVAADGVPYIGFRRQDDESEMVKGRPMERRPVRGQYFLFLQKVDDGHQLFYSSQA
jgi:hypothetical protein